MSADSSQFALGAVLLQLTDNNQWQPVEYASRKLTEAESRYAMIEKEALAITWACEKFDYYLVGRSFQIETDHRPLISLLGDKDLSKLPIRVQRFKLRLMRYAYSIFHTPGNKMFLADSLSRPCEPSLSVNDINRSVSVERYVNCLLQTTDIRGEELIQALSKDSNSLKCLEFLREGWPPTSVKLDGEIAKLYSSRSMLTVANGFIMFGSRFYIPVSLRESYLYRCHEGHQGIVKCKERARQLFWWPTVNNDICVHVSSCESCIKNARVTHQPWTSSLPEGPWVEIGTDVFEFNGELYLILVDYYSKWIETVRLECQTAIAVVNAMQGIFARLGVPLRVRSDNGPCYCGRPFRIFAEKWGFAHVTSSPRYPQSNGLAERSVGIVKSMWRKCANRENALVKI